MKKYRRSNKRILSYKARQQVKLASLIFFLTALILANVMRDSRLNTNTDMQNYHGNNFTVINVADGDTIYVDFPDNVARRGRTRIRLIGVDTPELGKKGMPDKPYARQATDFAIEQIMNKQVILKLEPNNDHRDKYHRLLAYVYLPDGETMLNELLISNGMGWPESRHPHLYQDRFEKLYKIARTNKAGLWGLDNPDLPSYFEQ